MEKKTLSSQNGKTLKFTRRLKTHTDDYDPAILTHPNIPKPLHGVNPRTIMGEEAWRELSSRLRNGVMFCQACGTSKFISGTFDCHEVYRIWYKPGIAKFVKFVCICKDCHNFIHDGRLSAMVDKTEDGKRDTAELEYFRIIDRGEAILKKHNLKKKPYDEDCAEWSKWRMIYEGKEYKPIYKNMKEWREHFGA